MKTPIFFSNLFILFALLFSSSVLAEESRLLRNPAISQEKITFAYAGDIWLANLDGTEVKRMTTFKGVENDPHFSPDGQYIAFTGEYDGNTDVFMVSVSGGEPQRLTWHPGADLVRGWSIDGSQVIFASGRTRVPYPYPDQLWQVPVVGGNPTPFVLPRAVDGKYSNDGKQFVYVQIMTWEEEFRNYRGGQNNPLRIFDITSHETEKLPWENSRDMNPVWVKDMIYFLSDRDFAMNIWSYHVPSKQLKQVSFFKDFDCKNLEGNQEKLIFEKGGYLFTMNIKDQTFEKLSLEIKGDFPWTRPYWTSIDKYISSASISPTGKRMVLSARGDIFTVPAKKGNARNISNSQGVADRSAVWSPDGKNIAWFSDESGEYRLVISDQFGKNKKVMVIDNPTFFYELNWSPDAKYLSFYNENRTLWIMNVDTGIMQEVDNEGFAHPEHVIYGEWAPDSKWLAYTKRLENEYSALFVYSLEQKKSFQITDGMSNCKLPAWDKSGKYIYFTASTDYGMNVGWLDMSSFDHPVTSSMYLAVLSKEEASPLAPESDDEEMEAEKPASPKKSKKKKEDDKEIKDEEENKVEPVKIDFEGLQQRIIALPLPAKIYVQLETAKEGVLLFTEQSPINGDLTLQRFTLEKRESEKVVEGIDGFEIAAAGEKFLYKSKEGKYIISEVNGKPDPGEETIHTSGIKMKIDPMKEWKQIFREAWRYQRDYFYVDNVHGLDLEWAYETYAPWVDHVKHRSDLNYVLDILGGETSIGHSFVSGGDIPEVDRSPIGLLGADYTIENNHYKIQKIYTGESWNAKVLAPLSAPGILIENGDYLLAVNGTPLEANTNLYSYFDHTADQQISITVNSQASMTGAKEVTVVPVPSEYLLRQHDWVESNRRKVDELSDGQLAYVWIPNTGQGGYSNFNRYYFAQKEKKGAIIDERFNQGGSIADYIVDLLSRELLGYFNNPIGDKQAFTAPNAGIWGPKVMIVNEMAGSGGDMLPYMFKLRKIGPIVGTTTWGGLVGIWDVPSLIDGGYMTSPRGGFYNLAGEWDVENIGVAPDIFVEQTAKLVIAGQDPQLEKAVETALELLKNEELILIPQPQDPIRVIRPKEEK